MAQTKISNILLLFLMSNIVISNLIELQERDDIYLVVCNETMPCFGEIVSDCMHVDKHCVIDCTNGGDSICRDAEFKCNPHTDCTLLCDSTHSPKACIGTILNASFSTNISVNIQCLNSHACEYMIIDMHLSENINLNITIKDVTDSQYPQYIFKHSEIYLPLTGNTLLKCIGYASCESLNIYGNTSQISYLDIECIGKDSFKDSYLSFPSSTNINMLCNDSESCVGARFDGTFSGMNSDINIICFGDNACSNTMIISNEWSEALMITVIGGGNNILSDANIFCKNENVMIECHDCNPQSVGPILHCDNNENNNNESCRLVFENNEWNLWKCLNNEIISCYDSGIFDSFESTFIQVDDNNNNNIDTSLIHNVKGQIVLTSIILILLALCVAVFIAKKKSIKEWIQHSFQTNENNDLGGMDIGVFDHSVMRIPDYNGTNKKNKKNKNNYESLDSMNDEDSELIVSGDTTDDQQ